MAAREAPSRHLGLDLGGTNIKAVVVEHDDDGWRVLDQDQVGTPAAQGPDRVVARLAEVGAEAIGRCPGVGTVGIGIPGLYDPVAGTTASITRNLGGEGVRTGARVLVTHGGIPVAKVERIHLQRINANRNKDRLDTHC